MAQLDSSIPMSVRSFNLGELADSFMVGRKFRDEQAASKQARQAAEQAQKLAQQVGNFQAETQGWKRKDRVVDEKKNDADLVELAASQREKRRARLHSILGDEAEVLSGLTPEKRKAYYTDHLVPGLKDDGFDVSDIDEYDDGLIDTWRSLALTPEQRQKARAPKDAPGPQLKVDANGNYVPVNPATGLNATTGQPVKAASQQFLTQGEGGFYTVSVPRGGTGSATPVQQPGGLPGQQLGPALKPVPDRVKEDVRDNEAQKRTAQAVLNAVNKLPNSPTSPGKQAVKQYLPFGNAVVDAWDPQGMQARQLIGQLSSIKIKDISGAAVSASEFPRLAQWIPQDGDTKPQATSKLQNFIRELDAINSEMGQQYSKDQGYKPDPVLNAPPAASPKPWQKRW